jgi:pyridoxine 5-phosphate synthase
LTTEGGLDVVGNLKAITESTKKLQDIGIKVSLFIDADIQQVEASMQSGAAFIEFHTGPYCEAFGTSKESEKLALLMQSAARAVELGLEVNAGHGLNYDNVGPVLELPGLVEFNIGHSIISEAVFSGIGSAVRRMKDLIS